VLANPKKVTPIISQVQGVINRRGASKVAALLRDVEITKTVTSTSGDVKAVKGVVKQANAERAATELMQAEAKTAMAEAAKRQRRAIKDAGDAKRAAAAAEAAAIKERDAAAAALVKKVKEAAAAAAKEAKAELERKTKEIRDNPSSTKWEQNKAIKALKQMDELRASEAAGAEKQAAADAKREATAVRMAWKAPTVDSKTPSDRDIQTQQFRRSSTAEQRRRIVERNAAASVPVPAAEPYFDADEKWHKPGRHIATLARPAKGRKALFDQKQEEGELEEAAMYQRNETTDAMYCQTLVWEFNSPTSVDDFLELMKRIIQDDLHPEGYFKVFTIQTHNGLPTGATGKYLTVSLGSIQQYLDLNYAHDIRGMLNAKQTKATMQQYGIQKVSGDFVTSKAPAALREVLGAWQSQPYSTIRLTEKPFSIPGGWKTVAEYAANTNDLLVVVNSMASTDKEHVWYTPAIARCKAFSDAYNAAVPAIKQTAMYKGVATPVNLLCKTGPGSAVSVQFVSAYKYAQVVESVGTPAEDEMQGLKSSAVYYCGPGASNSDVIQRVDFELNGVDGMDCNVLAAAI
jgi:hypothetical protein